MARQKVSAGCALATAIGVAALVAGCASGGSDAASTIGPEVLLRWSETCNIPTFNTNVNNQVTFSPDDKSITFTVRTTNMDGVGQALQSQMLFVPNASCMLATLGAQEGTLKPMVEAINQGSAGIIRWDGYQASWTAPEPTRHTTFTVSVAP